jgi:hypothetical protein
MTQAWSTEAAAVLWGAAALVALRIVLPGVLSALGLTFCRSNIDNDSAALEPAGDDAEYEELFGQLRRLGFVPVGARRNTYWFYLHHWRKVFHARLFAMPQGDSLAVTYKLRAWDRWRLSYVTAFSDEAIVETANQVASLRIEEPQHIRWGFVTADRGLLLERHRELCRHFASLAPRRIANLPAEEISRVLQAHEVRHISRQHRWTGLKSVSNAAFMIGLPVLVVRRCGTATPCLLPLSILTAGLLWPLVQAALFRAAARTFAEADARSRTD